MKLQQIFDPFRKFLVPSVLLIIIFIYFYPYIVNKQPLLSGNLLISFYSPWKYEPFIGWEHGIPNKPLGIDGLRFFYPLKKEILNQLNENKIPLWNPYNFSGNVLLGNLQSAVLYPINLLYFFTSFNNAWSLSIILVPLISGIFTYLLLRSYLLSKASSFFGAISFAFCGFLISWDLENPAVTHSAIWLPAVIYGVKKFVESKRLLFWYLSIFGIIFSILAGFLQFSIYLWLYSLSFTIAVFLKLKKTEQKRLLTPLSLIFLLSLVITAVQLLPSLEAYFNSTRETSSAEYLLHQYLLPITSLMTLVIPDIFGNPGTYNYYSSGFYYDKIIYVGLLPLLFSFYQFYSNRKVVSFFLIWVYICFLLGINNPLSQLFYHLKIPFLSAVSPSRIFYLSSFSIAVISAFGFESWKNEFNIRKLFKAIVSVSVLFGIGGVFIVLKTLTQLTDIPINPISKDIYLSIFPGVSLESKYTIIALRNFIFPLAIFIITVISLLLMKKIKSLKNIFILLLITLLIWHQYYLFKKHFFSTNENFIFPETKAISFLKENSGIDRILGIGSAQISPNLLSVYHLFSTDGMDPLCPKRYGELIYYINNGYSNTDIPRIEAKIDILTPDDILNQRKIKAISFMGIKYLLVPTTGQDQKAEKYTLPTTNFIKVWAQDNLEIWQNKQYFPRCWIVNNISVINDDNAILKQMFADDFDLRNKAILEEEPQLSLGYNNTRPNNVRIISYQADRISITTKTEENGILVCSDNYYPGWQASIDGQQTKIYRANYSFRAIIIPAGEHRISFIYKPFVLKIGLIISIAGFIVLITYGGYSRIIQKRRK
ncbi:MAG: YfhO family protein [Candidatus Gottesmanbacteria bacterium]